VPSDNVYGVTENGDTVALTRGMVVRIVANKSVVRAQADSTPHLQGLCGIVNAGSVAPGGPSTPIVCEAFAQSVLLEVGLTPIAGQTLYVSAAVAGRATNVQPTNAVAIGTIEDASTYTLNGTVFATVAIPAAIEGAGGDFPGYGGAPPPIAMGNAASGGVAMTAARSDQVNAQFLMADWPMTTIRTFLYDPVNGNDTNPGYSDIAGPYNPATQAKLTLNGIQSVLPRHFAGRTFRLIIASTTFANAELDQLLSGATGVGSGSVVRGTSTNATASSVAFQDDTADRTFVGATTATSCNAGGYNPTGGATTTVVPCQLNGGGAAGFGAEPASPLMWRLRFDNGTTTATLRNVCRCVIQVAGGNTLTLDSALPATPATNDIFYLEMGGVSYPSIRVGGVSIETTPNSSTAGLQFVGIRTAGAANYYDVWGTWSFCGGGATVIRATYNTTASTYFEPVAVTTLTVGGGYRADGGFAIINNLNCPLSNVLTTSVLTIQCFGQGQIDGVAAAGTMYSAAVMNLINLGNIRPFRVLGPQVLAGIEILAAYFGYADGGGLNINITGSGAKPAIYLRRSGAQVVLTSTVTGSTGNTDVGLDISQAIGATIYLPSQPTVTGTLGDIRLGGGTIISWATAMTGVVDFNGNRIFTSGNSPLGTAVASAATAVALGNVAPGTVTSSTPTAWTPIDINGSKYLIPLWPST
jgi:hypothetical protein